MDDSSEPTLPPMPSKSRMKRPSLNTRKRTHSTLRSSSLPPSASSDPALFSGDDECSASFENYVPDTKRKKKMYSGSWWSHRVKAGRDERKREFERNVDSGVFMMGDESEGLDGDLPSSDSLGSLEFELVRDMGAPQDQPFWQRAEAAVVPRAVPRIADVRDKTPPVETTPRNRVLRIIAQHLDTGNENVELSSMHLTDLPTEIAHLATLTTEPNLVPGMLDTGRPFEANLKVMLCNNFLREFPLPILSLNNLKILSLRGNGLRNIPGSISRLTNLVSLNVGGNKLKSLPFELLELAKNHKLKGLHARPNPWSDVMPEDGLSLSTRQMYSEARGTTSLTETALRSLHRIAPRTDLKELMPQETPTNVINALDDLSTVQREGGWLCTMCKRPFVTPGEEWLEYWAVSHPNSESVIMNATEASRADYIPFRRVACQSGCMGRETAWATMQRSAAEEERSALLQKLKLPDA